MVGGFAPLLSGCYVDATPPEFAVEGYQPAYCDGYVVYYDAGGRPFYYLPGGGVYWIPANHPYYGELVRHWGVYGHAYSRWYAHSGYRYRAYRRR